MAVLDFEIMKYIKSICVCFASTWLFDNFENKFGH